MALQSVGIVGAGAWGTALAITSRRAGRDVLIWAYEPETLADINERHRNEVYLPGISIDRAVEATARLNEVANCDLLLLATPAQHMRKIAGELAPYLKERQPLVLCSKGIEQSSGKLLSQVIAEAAPSVEIAVLSGPSFAAEVARGLPAAVTLATAEERLGRALSYALSHSPFRCYWSGDMIGAEIGGAMKNVYAIAAGIARGLTLGDNAIAALVTRGLAEMVRLGVAQGGQVETFYGLSGVGDLVATCYSEHSRNSRLGRLLGQGMALPAIIASTRMVAEGVPNTESLWRCAQAAGVRTPLLDEVHDVLYNDKPPKVALRELLGRDPRPEVD